MFLFHFFSSMFANKLLPRSVAPLLCMGWGLVLDAGVGAAA
jgi:hypothetical protein